VAAPAAAPPVSRTTPALVAAVVAGACVAVQQRVNGGFTDQVGEALVTALVSFGSGLMVAGAVVAGRPAARRAVAAVRSVPLWSRLGGLGGATLVGVGAAAEPKIGVALLTVGLVAGQTSGGILVDRAGVGPAERQALTLPRVGGALLCLVAVGVSVLGKAARDASPLLLALVVLAGFLVALQQALNGRVRAATGDASVATLVNFVAGGTALVVVLVLRLLVGPLHLGHWPGPGQWYLYAGGPLGAAFVAVAAVVVRQLGVLRLGVAVIAGQLLGAVVLDAAVPQGDNRLALATLTGAALTLVAVALTGVRR